MSGFSVKEDSVLGQAMKKHGKKALEGFLLGGPAGILGPIKAASSRLGKFLLGEAGKDVLPYGSNVRLRPTQMKEAFRGIDPNTKILGISQNEILQNLKEAKIGAQMRRALRKKIVKRKGNTEKLVDPAQRKN
tara:strand:- start:213 stop:611 length:399 start_codon:yes stop_codon:yes gene_type:complete